MRIPYLFLFLTLWAAYSYAQGDLSLTPPDPAPPLPPASLPTTGRGAVDFMVKAAPPMIGFLTMIGMMILKIEAPTIAEKIPAKYQPVLTAVIAAAVSAATAVGTEAVSPAGGVNWDVALVEGGGTGGGLQAAVNKLIQKVETKIDTQPPAKGRPNELPGGAPTGL